jgi:hypothetical protein
MGNLEQAHVTTGATRVLAVSKMNATRHYAKELGKTTERVEHARALGRVFSSAQELTQRAAVSCPEMRVRRHRWSPSGRVYL